MKTHQKIAITLSLTLSLLGCGGVGTDDTAIKDLPVAVNDVATANITQKKPTVIPVLANDTPPSLLDPTSVEIITPPEHGTYSISPTTGEVKYAPKASYTGTDSFTYTVKDKAGNYSNPATVTISATQTPFKITVKTDNKGASKDNQFLFTIISSNILSVDCGNKGAINGILVRESHLCTYPTAGTYTISVTGDIRGVPCSLDNDNLKVISVDQWGSGQWGSMTHAFKNCSNMTMTATDTPNLTKTTSFGFMFEGAKLFNGNISNWDVSNVTYMDSMFSGATAFNQDISAWNVSKVTEMSSMFFNAKKFANQNLSTWDVAKVTDHLYFLMGAGPGNTEPNWP
ncbi:MAG: BspA family leucine-rich repeat surface protein [Cocleimonas sp.]|nr:BspA family leucine-rich repeat surface protein [Cocleimonas sp.]